MSAISGTTRIGMSVPFSHFTSGGAAMKETKEQGRQELEKKLVLNKETIRILTDREMMEVQGATCGNVHPASTCPDYYTIAGKGYC
jgi:hypothetical protein